jgi:thiol-disulfide isomerase/thioredoxin
MHNMPSLTGKEEESNGGVRNTIRFFASSDTSALVIIIVLLLTVVAFIALRPSSDVMKSIAPDFSAETISHGIFVLSSHREKVVVLNFFVSSCSACRAELQELGEIWQDYGGRIVLASLSIDPIDSEVVLRDLSQTNGYGWIWMRGENLTVPYHILTTPTTVIVDQSGNIRFMNTGLTYASTIRQEIDQLLNDI